jgi:hypothetical protein
MLDVINVGKGPNNGAMVGGDNNFKSSHMYLNMRFITRHANHVNTNVRLVLNF